MNESTLRQAGIDYDAALARFVGKRSIYEKYLVKFLEDTHAMDAVKAFEQQDYAELLEQTHALKGVAGTLGMTSLFEVSADIVNDLRSEKHGELSEKITRMLEEQERLSQVIKSAEVAVKL